MSSTPPRRARRRRSPAPERDGASSTVRGWLGSVPRVVTVLGAVLGALVAATTLIDWISSRGSDEAPPSIDARLLDVKREGAVQTLGEYVAETRPKTKPQYTAEQLREVGYVFAVRLSIEGQLKQRLPLRWSMHEGSSGRPLSGRVYNQVAATFIPEATRHARTWPVWVPLPPTAGRYFVRFVLVGPDSRPEDDRETPVFRYQPAPRDDV